MTYPICTCCAGEHLERAIGLALDMANSRVSLPARGVRCSCGELAAITVDTQPVCEACFNAARAKLAAGSSQLTERVRALDKKAGIR